MNITLTLTPAELQIVRDGLHRLIADEVNRSQRWGREIDYKALEPVDAVLATVVHAMLANGIELEEVAA